jgi:hypothetical protein
MPTPIGPETYWLCPSVQSADEPNTQYFFEAAKELISDQPITGWTFGSSFIGQWLANTDKGGIYEIKQDFSERNLLTALGNPAGGTVDKIGFSWWSNTTQSTIDNGYIDQQFKVGFTSNDIFPSVEVSKTVFNSAWTQTQAEMLLSVYFPGGGAITRLQLKASASGGWTEQEFDDYLLAYKHMYLEINLQRGAAGANSAYTYFPRANGYWDFYLDGVLVDSSTITLPNGKTLTATDGSGFGAGFESSLTWVAADKTQQFQNGYWDDFRIFGDVMPTASQIADLATMRGFEPAPAEPPTPIGPETFWLCPTLNPDQDGVPDDLINGLLPSASSGTVTWTADTDNGGQWKTEGSSTDFIAGDTVGSFATGAVGQSMWLYTDASHTSSDQTIFAFGDAFNDHFQLKLGLGKLGSTFILGQAEFKIEAFDLNNIIIAENEFRCQTNQGWTEQEWDDLWLNKWNHIYVEYNPARGSAGAGSDYGFFATDPWLKIYFNGVALDSSSLVYPDNGKTMFLTSSVNLGAGTSPAFTLTGTSPYSIGSTVAYDDARVFGGTVPDDTQIAALATTRGYEPPAPKPVGIGDEKLWLCPTLDTAAINTADLTDLSASDAPIHDPAIGATVWTANTDSGGAYLIDQDDSTRLLADTIGTSGTTMSASLWILMEDDPMASSRSGEKCVIDFGGGNYLTGATLSININRHSNFGGALYYFDITASNFQVFPSSYCFGGAGIENTTSDPNFPAVSGLHHLVVTYDTTKPDLFGTDRRFSFYWDGVEVTATPGAGVGQTNPPPPTWDFSAITDPTFAYNSTTNGVLQPSIFRPNDDVRLFDRILTQAEITALASQRGYTQGASTPPVGLGDEKQWYCAQYDPTAADLGTNGNDGVISGGVTIVDSDGDDCFEFNGTDGMITAPVDTLHGSADITMSAWVNVQSSIVSGDHAIMGQDDFGANYPVSTGQMSVEKVASNGELRPELNWSTASNDYKITGQSQPNRYDIWIHMAGTFDSTNHVSELYLNGVSLGTKAFSGTMITNPAMPFKFGTCGLDGSETAWLEGQLDDMRSYTRILTVDEIAHLATSRGIEGGPTPPTTGFYNPFINKIFNNDYTRRIR